MPVRSLLGKSCLLLSSQVGITFALNFRKPTRVTSLSGNTCLSATSRPAKMPWNPQTCLYLQTADCDRSQLLSADGVPPAVTSSSQIGMPSSQAAYSMVPSMVTA